MKKNLAISLLLLCSTLLLVACGPTRSRYLVMKYVTTDTAPEPSVNKNAQQQIAETATSVSHSLQSLNELELATHRGDRLKPPVNASRVGLAQMVSISWHGPVGALLKQIGSATGYRIKTLGVVPSVPVLVDLNAKQQTMAAILRNVTFQVQKAADIKLYPRSKVIEIRYHI